MSKPDDKQIIGAAKAAELLGVDRRQVLRFIAADRIRGAEKIGEGTRAAWAIPASEVTRLAKERALSGVTSAGGVA